MTNLKKCILLKKSAFLLVLFIYCVTNVYLMPFYRYGDANCFTRSVRTFAYNNFFLHNNDLWYKKLFPKNPPCYTFNIIMQCLKSNQTLFQNYVRRGSSASNLVTAILVP